MSSVCPWCEDLLRSCDAKLKGRGGLYHRVCHGHAQLADLVQKFEEYINAHDPPVARVSQEEDLVRVVRVRWREIINENREVWGG